MLREPRQALSSLVVIVVLEVEVTSEEEVISEESRCLASIFAARSHLPVGITAVLWFGSSVS
jgi:hypothetical protein